MTYGNCKASPTKLYQVKQNCLADDFPTAGDALKDPDGLLAIGGDLGTTRLLDAYLQGIFPWFNDGQPILWWTPDPRCVMAPTDIRISRSLGKRLRKNEYTVTCNRAFKDVIEGCAAARKGVESTWITPEVKLAYWQLHQQGYAHSVECWYGNSLAGGLYGIALGKVFFGESMFSRRNDASKVALVHFARQLEQRRFRLIDCQVHSRHLEMLGAKSIRRELFLDILHRHASLEKTTDWQ